MFTSRSALLVVALSTPALIGWTVGNENQDDPAGAARSSAAASQGQANSDRQPAIVLLHDGRIVKGMLSKEDGFYVVTQPVGSMRFPERRVEKIFASIQEVYNYKFEQVPENDFDEGIKLARWCLEQKLEPEARRQLDAILKRSPKHVQARAMLTASIRPKPASRIGCATPKSSKPGRSWSNCPPESVPTHCDTAVIYGARRRMGISELPVIFDLPAAQAVKRTDEFARAMFSRCCKRTVLAVTTKATKANSGWSRSRASRIEPGTPCEPI